ncbi:hypothetical protein [Cutibacterium sp.]|uniref:hypothetical protein n=1 Tax=Cutibacterium sp. TaxID=1912221 RepID=UPI0026DC40F0|nr:hypothetical protein [Cutibacterium sp.]MDO4413140.1 hypothetical protein [Cutibacterium sp.]
MDSILNLAVQFKRRRTMESGHFKKRGGARKCAAHPTSSDQLMPIPEQPNPHHAAEASLVLRMYDSISERVSAIIGSFPDLWCSLRTA